MTLLPWITRKKFLAFWDVNDVLLSPGFICQTVFWRPALSFWLNKSQKQFLVKIIHDICLPVALLLLLLLPSSLGPFWTLMNTICFWSCATIQLFHDTQPQPLLELPPLVNINSLYVLIKNPPGKAVAFLFFTLNAESCNWFDSAFLQSCCCLLYNKEKVNSLYATRNVDLSSVLCLLVNLVHLGWSCHWIVKVLLEHDIRWILRKKGTWKYLCARVWRVSTR